MVLKEKRNDLLEKRFARDDKLHHRVANQHHKKVYFLIVCEGEKTEPNYFASFADKFQLNIDIVGTAKETLRVVKKAIDIRSQKTIEPFYDSVWTVFDKDSFSERDFNSAIKKANDHNIKCAWSNEAFELWYILHFEYMHTGLMRKDYKKKLEVHIKKKEGKYFKYKKNIENMYELLAKYGSQKQAINWAKKLEENHIVRGREYAKQNPCTRVYALVEELNNPETILKST